MKLNFRFPEGKQELVKNAFKIMGESFQRWRSELNKKYIQKGLTPFNEFGNITPSQWEELVAQKTYIYQQSSLAYMFVYILVTFTFG